MIDAKQFLVAAGASTGALAFAAGYGEGLARIGAYLLAAVFGVLTYVWTDRPGGRGAIGVVITGYALGTSASLLASAFLFVWFLEVSVDIALWQSLLFLLLPWFGIGAALVGGAFLTGLAAAFE